MNERITAIMQQCFDISIDQRGREECTADYLNIQLFVQLIVKECACAIIQHMEQADSKRIGPRDDLERGYDGGATEAAQLITNLFTTK